MLTTPDDVVAGQEIQFALSFEISSLKKNPAPDETRWTLTSRSKEHSVDGTKIVPLATAPVAV
jgi:hypothetical protein